MDLRVRHPSDDPGYHGPYLLLRTEFYRLDEGRLVLRGKLELSGVHRLHIVDVDRTAAPDNCAVAQGIER